MIIVVIALMIIGCVDATSMKIDFVRLTNVRTDPITNPNGFSPHVHSFFGAAEVKPSTTYDDLRNSKDRNTGNIEENLSLYWHPSIYRYNKKTKKYTIQDTSLFSTYYIWETGAVKSFPDGLKIIGGGYPDLDKSLQNAECVNPGKCPNGDCETWNDFFPATTCDELEMSMRMPSCWDGVNLDSFDHRSHVVYPEDSEPDGACPKSHPVQLPQIAVFTRIMPYKGGIHVFSDGTGYFHADYFSGWDSKQLQKVLDECENDSFAPMPTAWCENFVTFRDAPKNKKSNEVDMSKLEKFQPSFDKVAYFENNGFPEIGNEVIDNVFVLPGKGTPKPTTKTPTTKKPTTKKPTQSPSFKPETKEPTKEPTTNKPTLRPSTKNPTLAPTAEETESNPPSSKSPVPEDPKETKQPATGNGCAKQTPMLYLPFALLTFIVYTSN